MVEPGCTLGSLVARGLARGVDGDASVRVRGIRHDSRAVEPGDVFACIDGVYRRDGTSFVPDALARGAAALLSERPLDAPVPVLRVDDAQRALAAIAAELYGDPTAQLGVVGVTGTNGKTTVSYLLEAILTRLGHPTAVIGTVSFRAPGVVREATHTTPMADDLMRLALWAREAGASHLLLEVSSHALAMHRADGVHFEVVAFTNLSQDHLDYHGDLDRYGAAKARLFLELDAPCAVINVDDGFGGSLAARFGGPRLLRCSTRPEAEAEIKALEVQHGRSGIEARLQLPDGEQRLQSPLIGAHNLENLLVAIGCALGLGLPARDVVLALKDAAGAPGRLERVAHPEDVLVFVDYAHSPDALERALGVLRSNTRGRLLVVFGCGGDRDTTKRPIMGEIAGRLADLSLLTSDNPRSEEPLAILAQIEAGARGAGRTRLADTTELAQRDGYWVEPDRRRAIALAIEAARPGDTVLIAGKGHETVQITGAVREPFDDRVEAASAIAARRAH
jgi:UDP-N-acetylmuramoyl-L-alanyl-D-glutamate--2,6-diaminopimelate ligase